MLKSADFVVITKGDIVSQAEREVFAARVTAVNPKAVVMHVNGLNGQGAFELSTLLYDKNQNIQTLEGMKLRFQCLPHFVLIVWEKHASENNINLEMCVK